jgi:hypothetical protein
MPKLLKDMAAEAPDSIPEQLRHRRFHEIVQNWTRDSARVADLARMPEKVRGHFSMAVCDAISDAWDDADVRSTASEIHQDKALSRAIDALRTAKQALADLGFQGATEGRGALICHMEENIDLFLAFVLGAAEPTRRRIRGLGRPPGTIANPIGEKFVRSLWQAAEVFGGRLTFNKNYGSGTLKETLEILRAHLPSGGIVEDNSTLQRIITSERSRLKAELERFNRNSARRRWTKN